MGTPQSLLLTVVGIFWNIEPAVGMFSGNTSIGATWNLIAIVHGLAEKVFDKIDIYLRNMTGVFPKNVIACWIFEPVKFSKKNTQL